MIRQGLAMGALVLLLLVGATLGRAPGGADAEVKELLALLKRSEALRKEGKWREAIAVEEQLVAKARAVFGPNDVGTANLTINLAGLYRAVNQLDKAELHYRQGLKALEARFPGGHPNLVAGRNNLAGVYRAQGWYEKAEPLYVGNLKLLEASPKKDLLAVAISLNNLAALYHDMGETEKALPLAERGLKIKTAQLGENHLEVAKTQNYLASLYGTAGQYEKAEALFERALRALKAKLPPDHPDLAQCLADLGVLYRDMGQYQKAEGLLRSGLKIREARLGKEHPAVATTLDTLAGLYRARGQYDRAEPLYQRALKVREARLPKGHPEVALSLNNLALLSRDLGQFEKAEALLLRSLKMLEDKLGKQSPQLAAPLNNLAELYRGMGQPEKAERLLQRCLDVLEAKLPRNHPNVGRSLNNLGLLYHARGRFASAETMFLRAGKVYEASSAAGHPEGALTLSNLADVYHARGQHEKAIALYQRSLKALEAQLGAQHPTVTNILSNLAVTAADKGDAREAARLIDRARRGSRRHLATVLPTLSEPEKAAFFKNTGARGGLEMALSLGLANRDDAGLAALSASWLLNGKALDQEALASSLLLARQSNDPGVGKLAQRLLVVRQQLARLTLATPRPGQEKEHRKQIEEGSDQEQRLSKQLRKAGSKAALPAWVELADLRKALPKDAVLIEVAHFRPFDFKVKPGKSPWRPARYAAWVTPRSGPVRVIDLGPADKIDAAVKQFRAAMKGSGKLIKDKGEEHAEKALREHLDALSTLVLAPLLPHVGKSERWFVSPDGNLWLLPWEALTLADGKYALEKYHVSYLTSGRDLLPAVAPKVKVGAPLVLADPDFDLGPQKARAEAKRLLGALDEEGTRSLSGALALGEVRRLPGTAAEARAILPSLKAHAGVAPHLFLREQALTAVFRSARSPRVLVLCTHGFFLPDQEVPRDEKGGLGKPKRAVRWESPLLRCGLLLAGCNQASKGGTEGVLTGLEVVGTDLRGTELVVLSACDTGLGEVQVGEGVAGLRQAFQLAGARAVVSTLWQVPDKQSARLMALFFQNVSKGMTKSEALRAAKLKIIEERRDDFAAAHPFSWAAFTLTGQ